MEFIEYRCAVAAVTPSGVATGVAPGTVTITAMSGSISGTATLSVIPAVLTYHYDTTGAGVNAYETTLTTSNVNSTTFGKKFSLSVDGAIYAQPLYVPNVAIPGEGTHNVLYVATANDSLYAFDADSNTGSSSTPLWQVSVIDTAHGAASGATVVQSSNLGCSDISPTYGITSTPVIDLSSGTIYLVANSIENGNNIYRLHALDITSGAEKSGSPVVITASVTGTGDGSVGGRLTFDPVHHLNRAALVLTSGNVYIAFGSHCDTSPWHGWLFSYNGASLAQSGVFVTTPNGGMGGIWMSGSGVAADANGNLYLATGNGTFDTTNVPATELGDSIIKLNASNLALLDYFTPYNQLNMSNGDLDLGSGGVLLLGNQSGNYANLLLQSGKTGSLYLINRDQMTTGNSHYCSISCGNTDPEIVQEVQSANNGMWSSLAYWNENVYLSGCRRGFERGLFEGIFPHKWGAQHCSNFEVCKCDWFPRCNTGCIVQWNNEWNRVGDRQLPKRYGWCHVQCCGASRIRRDEPLSRALQFHAGRRQSRSGWGRCQIHGSGRHQWESLCWDFERSGRLWPPALTLCQRVPRLNYISR